MLSLQLSHAYLHLCQNGEDLLITEDFWLAINQLEFMVRRGMARIKAEYGEYISSNAAATDAVVVPAIANGETLDIPSQYVERVR